MSARARTCVLECVCVTHYLTEIISSMLTSSVHRLNDVANTGLCELLRVIAQEEEEEKEEKKKTMQVLGRSCSDNIQRGRRCYYRRR